MNPFAQSLALTLGAILDSHEKHHGAALLALSERVRRAAAALNDGLEPTADRNGMMHAPCDGYLWTYQDGAQEITGRYMGGQFLPIPSETEKLRQRFNVRGALRLERVPLELAEELFRETLHLRRPGVFSLGMGQEFDTPDDGRCCHLYLETRSAAARESFAEFIEEQVYAPRRAELEEREKAEREAFENAEPCPEGRVTVTGKLLGWKTQETRYGTTCRCLVQDRRGFKVWGTLPRAWEEAERGSPVTFSAELTPSREDPKFGFFKRPTKARILEEEAA
jgi:hypothetical protein